MRFFHRISRMKKWFCLLGVAFVLAFIFCFATYRLEGRYLRPTGYVSCFKRNNGYYYRQFARKIRAVAPLWMQRQIAQDLTLERVTLPALEATQRVIAKNSVHTTNRYRIVNRRLYRYVDPVSARIQEGWNAERRAPVDWFEKGLKTLIELTSLPNLDFIVAHEDGTREPFYQVEDRDLQAPVLGWAKLQSTPFLVLIPDWRSLSFWWHDDIRKLREGKNFRGRKFAWGEKKGIAFWRGALTESMHRLKMASLSVEFPSLIDAGISAGLGSSDLRWKPPASYAEHLQYKYLPVLDGIMCSYPGYQWRLLSDAVVFKQESDQIQWFYGALSPYEHYVPIKNDLSDVIDQVVWAQAHDDACRQIASNATEFALKNLMFDDVYCYLYHVLIAYSRLQDMSLEKDWDVTHASPDWLLL